MSTATKEGKVIAQLQEWPGLLTYKKPAYAYLKEHGYQVYGENSQSAAITKNGQHYYMGTKAYPGGGIQVGVVAFMSPLSDLPDALNNDRRYYFLTKEDMREMANDALEMRPKEITLYTNYGMELHHTENARAVFFDEIVKVIKPLDSFKDGGNIKSTPKYKRGDLVGWKSDSDFTKSNKEIKPFKIVREKWDKETNGWVYHITGSPDTVAEYEIEFRNEMKTGGQMLAPGDKVIKITPYQYHGWNYKKQIVWVDSSNKNPDPMGKMIWGYGEFNDPVSDFKGFFERAGAPVTMHYTPGKHDTHSQEISKKIDTIRAYVYANDEKMAAGGTVKKERWAKEERVIIAIAIGQLATYKHQFSKYQTGYTATQQLIEDWSQSPTNIGLINMAIISLQAFYDDYPLKKLTEQGKKAVHDTIQELKTMAEKYADKGINYMGLPGDRVVIEWNNKHGYMAEYYLTNADTFAKVNMFFSSPDEVKKYIDKKGLKIVDNFNNERDNFKAGGNIPADSLHVGDEIGYLNPRTGRYKFVQITKVLPEENSYELTEQIYVARHHYSPNVYKQTFDQVKRFTNEIDAEGFNKPLWVIRRKNKFETGGTIDDEKIKDIAAIFSKILWSADWIGPEDMPKVIAENKSNNDDTCATHDYVDANMAMDEAFTSVMGRQYVHFNDEDPETEKQNEIDTDYTNRAWMLAKDNDFDVERIHAADVNSFATGGNVNPANKESIGFIPMDIEQDLANIARFGGTNIKGVIGFLSAMIDSGLTDDDLKTSPTKTGTQYEKAKHTKVEEIWGIIEPNYKGDLKGNMYYSTIKQLVQRADNGDNNLKKFKPFRKYQKYSMDGFAKGGKVNAGIARDRKFKSQEPHEQAYQRKTSPVNPHYKERGGNINKGQNLDIYGYQTQNFDMCEGMAPSFKNAMEQIDLDMDNESAYYKSQQANLKAVALEVDEILHLEKIAKYEDYQITDADVTKVMENMTQASVYNHKCGNHINIAELLGPHIATLTTAKNNSGKEPAETEWFPENDMFEKGGNIPDIKAGDIVTINSVRFIHDSQHWADTPAIRKFYVSVHQHMNDSGQVVSVTPGTANVKFSRGSEIKIPKSILQKLELDKKEDGGTFKKGGTIETDTPILPEFIAYTVANNFIRDKYNNPTSQQMKDAPNQIEKLSIHLVEKANDLYKTSPFFKKKMNQAGNKGRDALYTFMEHWAQAYDKNSRFRSGGTMPETEIATDLNGVMGFEEFMIKKPEIKSPYWGDEDIIFKAVFTPSTGVTRYYKNGRRNSENVSMADAYISYIYDQNHVNFKSLESDQKKKLFGKYANRYSFRKGGMVQYGDIAQAETDAADLKKAYIDLKQECEIKLHEAYEAYNKGSDEMQKEFNIELDKLIQKYFNNLTTRGSLGLSESSVYWNYKGAEGDYIPEVIILSSNYYGGKRRDAAPPDKKPSIILFGGKGPDMRKDILLDEADTPKDVIKKILKHKYHITRFAGKEILKDEYFAAGGTLNNNWQVYYMDNDGRKKIIEKNLTYSAALKLSQKNYSAEISAEYESMESGGEIKEPGMAETLVQQLSKQTLFMLGAYNPVKDTKNNWLSFRIKGSSKVNYIKITLEWDDTYTMEFGRIRKVDPRTALRMTPQEEYAAGYKVVNTIKDVYAEDLHSMIETNTGLYTKLFEQGGAIMTGDEPKELYYVQDAAGKVKNISTKAEDADTFLAKSLKYAGNVYVALVPKKDWDAEKINTSNIKNYSYGKYEAGGKVGGGPDFLHIWTFRYKDGSTIIRTLHDKYMSPSDVLKKVSYSNSDLAGQQYSGWSSTNDKYKEFFKLKKKGLSDKDAVTKIKENDEHYEAGGQVNFGTNGLLHALLEFVSSGTIANKTGLRKYKDIDGVRSAAIQMLLRDGDREYSMSNLEKLLGEAKDEWAENKAEHEFAMTEYKDGGKLNNHADIDKKVIDYLKANKFNYTILHDSNDMSITGIKVDDSQFHPGNANDIEKLSPQINTSSTSYSKVWYIFISPVLISKHETGGKLSAGAKKVIRPEWERMLLFFEMTDNKVPQPVQNLVNDMIDKKIYKKTVTINNDVKFLNDAKPAVDKGYLIVTKSNEGEKRYDIRLGKGASDYVKYAEGGTITKVDTNEFPLAEQQRLIQIFLDDQSKKKQVLKELLEYHTSYLTTSLEEPKSLLFGKPYKWYVDQYKNAFLFVRDFNGDIYTTLVESVKYPGQFTFGPDNEGGFKPMYTGEEIELMKTGHVIELELRASRTPKDKMLEYKKEIKQPTVLTHSENEFGGNWRLWKKNKKETGKTTGKSDKVLKAKEAILKTNPQKTAVKK